MRRLVKAQESLTSANAFHYSAMQKFLRLGFFLVLPLVALLGMAVAIIAPLYLDGLIPNEERVYNFPTFRNGTMVWNQELANLVVSHPYWLIPYSVLLLLVPLYIIVAALWLHVTGWVPFLSSFLRNSFEPTGLLDYPVLFRMSRSMLSVFRNTHSKELAIGRLLGRFSVHFIWIPVAILMIGLKMAALRFLPVWPFVFLPVYIIWIFVLIDLMYLAMVISRLNRLYPDTYSELKILFSCYMSYMVSMMFCLLISTTLSLSKFENLGGNFQWLSYPVLFIGFYIGILLNYAFCLIIVARAIKLYDIFRSIATGFRFRDSERKNDCMTFCFVVVPLITFVHLALLAFIGLMAAKLGGMYVDWLWVFSPLYLGIPVGFMYFAVAVPVLRVLVSTFHTK